MAAEEPPSSTTSNDGGPAAPVTSAEIEPNHDQESASSARHTSIVLFYKYFSPQLYPVWHRHVTSASSLSTRKGTYYRDKMLRWQTELGHCLGLKGRIALAAEGINGTLSASSADALHKYAAELERFELLRDWGLPPSDPDPREEDKEQRAAAADCPPHFLFSDIDWKTSTNERGSGVLEPFPDLKIFWADEIVGSGGSISAEDLDAWGGRHLSPREFHQALQDNPDAVVIDVRNAFEYRIGHFVHPLTGQPAVNPDTVTFGTFDSGFCRRNAESLRDKKVMLYCTGGIRCEKASAMLRKRGVDDVVQLQGGIHRYLEEFGREESCFRGLNFVYDQRVTMAPPTSPAGADGGTTKESIATTQAAKWASTSRDVVGRCIECDAPFDEYCGSRICAVCRDLVLACPKCQSQLQEYHCARHAAWKSCYFFFLERYNAAELAVQQSDLESLLRGARSDRGQSRKIRQTLARQIEKVAARRRALEAGAAQVHREAPRRCRTCGEASPVCDGRCWGFWKTARSAAAPPSVGLPKSWERWIPLHVGDRVQPGPHWNTAVLGSKEGADGRSRRGVVEELRVWGAGGLERDCALVKWDDGDDGGAPDSRRSRSQRKLYRWGVLTPTGSRLYDLDPEVAR